MEFNHKDEAGSIRKPSTVANQFILRNWKVAASVVLTVAGGLLGGNSIASKAILGLAIVVGGWATARSAIAAVKSRALDMNVLMSVAVIGAIAMSDWLEAASVVALFGVGNRLQIGAMDRTRESIRSLMQLSPTTASVVTRDGVQALPVEQVNIGDIVSVKPGERVAVDGVITVGTSFLNEAPITGESSPVEKIVGDKVFAGSLNGNGAIEFRAICRYADTTLATIVHRVEEAQAQRAPTQQLIDRFASRYTPAVVGLALAVSVLPPLFSMISHVKPDWYFWCLRGLSLLIIACPCALVISTPVAVVTGIGVASRRGALIKGGAYLEAIGRIKAILFDKTGTLTSGQFHVAKSVATAEISREDLIAIAAAVESLSEHPIAKAFASENHRVNKHRHLKVENFRAETGMGAFAEVEGVRYSVGNLRFMRQLGLVTDSVGSVDTELRNEGGSVVLLADSEKVIGAFLVSDSVRTNAAEIVGELRNIGIGTLSIVTGDNRASADAVAKQVGVTECNAEQMPDDKLTHVRTLLGANGEVAMVGDGINDAPALALSTVGIAMGAAGSDVAIETADIALMHDDLALLPFLIRLGRETRLIMLQNIWFSLLTKGILILVAVSVGLPLWLAVFGDVGVSLIVTANALRLRSFC